jgi:hypothetical protein
MTQGLVHGRRENPRDSLQQALHQDVRHVAGGFVKPGTPMRDMLRHRASVGQFSGDIDRYMEAIHERIARVRARNSS